MKKALPERGVYAMRFEMGCVGLEKGVCRHKLQRKVAELGVVQFSVSQVLVLGLSVERSFIIELESSIALVQSVGGTGQETGLQTPET
jgi:hypothetical protein